MRGRKPKIEEGYRTLTAIVPISLKRRLRSFAESHGITMSDIVRQSIERYLDEHEGAEGKGTSE